MKTLQAPHPQHPVPPNQTHIYIYKGALSAANSNPCLCQEFQRLRTPKQKHDHRHHCDEEPGLTITVIINITTALMIIEFPIVGPFETLGIGAAKVPCQMLLAEDSFSPQRGGQPRAGCGGLLAKNIQKCREKHNRTK